MIHYQERLWVPARWWLLLVVLSGFTWIIVQHAYGPGVSWPVTGAVLAAGAVALLNYGRLRIVVEDDAVTVGPARLPATALGPAEALSDDAAWQARGPELHPRAHLTLRGYVSAVARIGVGDPADPTPYWLVSTRHPERFVAALEAVRSAAESG